MRWCLFGVLDRFFFGPDRGLRLTGALMRHLSVLRAAAVFSVAGLASTLSLGPSAQGAASDTSISGTPAVSAGSGERDEAAALALAASSGVSVPVDRLRSETTEVVANPDGTFTADIAVAPVRVRQGGAWVPVDSTLVANADGTFSPRASVTDMRFSGGGSAPLFRLTRGAVAVDVSWPGTLPVPEVAGNTAVYREVYPGVDVEVSAAGASVSHRVVVKTREAAKNPRVRNVTYGNSVSGGKRVSKGAGAGFVVTDLSGAPVFEAPEAIMWDSSSTSPVAASALSDSADGSDASAATAASDTSADSGDSGETDDVSVTSEAPRDGDKVADLPVSLGADASGAGTLTVAASTAMLDASSTVFPVAIDPVWTETDPTFASNWTMVDQKFPDVSYYKYTSDQGVGYQDYDSWSRKRLYYTFSTSRFDGTSVKSAIFNAREVFSATCDAGTVDAYLTKAISTSTTWNNQPDRLTGIAGSFARKAGRSDCLPGGTNGEWDLTSEVAGRVNAGASHVVVQLAGRSESTDSSWMRFLGPNSSQNEYRPTLEVTYNTPPVATPAGRMKAPLATIDCGTLSAPVRLNPEGSNAYLFADLYDAQGGDLEIAFRVQGSGYNKIYYLLANAVADGVWTQKKAPMSWFGLADGSYSWDVVTREQGQSFVNWSPKCYFVVDTTDPPLPALEPVDPTVDLSQLQPTSTSSVNMKFTSAGAVSFPYSVAGAVQSPLTTVNGTKEMAIPLAKVGVQLSATAKDAAANESDPSVVWLNRAVPQQLSLYSFLSPLPDGTPPLGAATLRDSDPETEPSGWELPLPTDQPTALGRWADCTDVVSQSCLRDKALSFEASAASTVVTDHRPVRTDESFTVGAWVKVSQNTGRATILEQKGAAGGYSLTYDSDANGGKGRFEFTVRAGTAVATAVDGILPGDAATPPDPSRLDEWYYVAGVYDKSTNAIRVLTVWLGAESPFEVRRAGPDVAVAGPPGQAEGSFFIGDARPGDTTGAVPFVGSVDELSFWQVPQTAAGTSIRSAALLNPFS